ncbi:MAG: NAD(P)-dependent alcohol dehydrogenase [Ancrocorticia sp.]|uniref:NAD(P)-dependent alcohol dehydrogenase n=1 Tax=Ancrocorticia sp. TaxID=2593684 RepID=UPI003F8F844F
MTTTVNAYAATSATDPLVPITIERRDLRPHDVKIDIEYAGICHSDIHTVRGEWGPITYPQVVGHEIAGITTYSPLRHWNAGPGKRVAIIGMGGLGHMGVKIAVALGADVTVLSRGTKKKDDALRFGAHRYVDTTDPEAVRELTGGLDLIINTVSAGLDLATYLGLLDVDGALVNVGAPAEPFSVPAFSLVPARRTLAGSTTGGIPEIEEMLAFCAEHGILPETELIGADRINEAYERVLASDVRYRFVIDASTFD